MNPLIFTGLDGTLLDDDDFSYGDAKAALDRIRRQQIPLIFTTSKTRLEIERLQAAMEMREPFVAGNGAAIFFPNGYRNFKIDAGFRQTPYTVIQLGMNYRLPHADGSYESIDLLNLVKADRPGSRGWNDAILDALNSLEEWRMAK